MWEKKGISRSAMNNMLRIDVRPKLGYFPSQLGFVKYAKTRRTCQHDVSRTMNEWMNVVTYILPTLITYNFYNGPQILWKILDTDVTQTTFLKYKKYIFWNKTQGSQWPCTWQFGSNSVPIGCHFHSNTLPRKIGTPLELLAQIGRKLESNWNKNASLHPINLGFEQIPFFN